MSEEMSEDMSENLSECRNVRKECEKKCQIERLYWTASIELQAPRRLKTDVATTIILA